MEPIWAIGLMTGTVLDGNIDVALVKTDGLKIFAFGGFAVIPYRNNVNILLAQCLEEARDWNFEGPDPTIFAEAEQELTRAQAQAVARLVSDTGLSMFEIGVVGFHGQTVLHRAPQPNRRGQTRQLGDGALMAQILETPVAYDFRSKDIKAGGQGAPLCSIYHRVLLDDLGAGPNVAILNLGGVANITWRNQDGLLVGFDTGPASAPLNDFVKARGLGEMDRDGILAKSGKVDEKRLSHLLEHPYLAAPYPKSLDRFDFSADMADGLSASAGAALLTAFIAATVGKGLDLLPQRPEKIIVCGGGRNNATIMSELENRAGVKAIIAEQVGWNGDATEAEGFAFLGVRALWDLPISFPTTTGVAAPITGGRLALP